jgi:hypothetical protein
LQEEDKERFEKRRRDLSGGRRYRGELRKERDLSDCRKKIWRRIEKRKKSSEWRKKIRRRIEKRT